GDGSGEQIALAVDVHDGVAGASAGSGGGGDCAAAGGRADAEAAGFEGGVFGELHFHRAHEDVLLAGGVIGRGVRHFFGEHVFAPVLDLLVILGGQVHDEGVRYHGAAAGECGSAFVHVSTDGTGDLHGFQLGAERFRERAVDHPFD